jgi:hypothetical protein
VKLGQRFLVIPAKAGIHEHPSRKNGPWPVFMDAGLRRHDEWDGLRRNDGRHSGPPAAERLTGDGRR